jgi:hypothetical protein
MTEFEPDPNDPIEKMWALTDPLTPKTSIQSLEELWALPEPTTGMPPDMKALLDAAVESRDA